MASEEQISRIHELRARHWTPKRIGERVGLSFFEVREILGMNPCPGAVSEAAREAMRAAAAAGEKISPLAERFHVSRNTAQRICASVGRPADVIRENKAAAGRLGSASLARRLLEEQQGLQVPKWVPDRLRDLYATISERDCEEQAAIVCRRLKHGASVAWL